MQPLPCDRLVHNSYEDVPFCCYKLEPQLTLGKRFLCKLHAVSRSFLATDCAIHEDVPLAATLKRETPSTNFYLAKMTSLTVITVTITLYTWTSRHLFSTYKVTLSIAPNCHIIKPGQQLLAVRTVLDQCLYVTQLMHACAHYNFFLLSLSLD